MRWWRFPTRELGCRRTGGLGVGGPAHIEREALAGTSWGEPDGVRPPAPCVSHPGRWNGCGARHRLGRHESPDSLEVAPAVRGLQRPPEWWGSGEAPDADRAGPSGATGVMLSVFRPRITTRTILPVEVPTVGDDVVPPTRVTHRCGGSGPLPRSLRASSASSATSLSLWSVAQTVRPLSIRPPPPGRAPCRRPQMARGQRAIRG